MPKFSDTEKEIIRQKLFKEGERLFTVFGLKKVSIDELIHATGIAKGSFYSFYPSKEHLFFDIITHQQKQMWLEMEAYIQANRQLPPRELVKQTFMWMIGQFNRYPLIQGMDNDATEYLMRKLPADVLEEHTKDDSAELLKLQEYGVQFTCEIPMAAKIMQTMSMGFFSLQQENEATRLFIMDTVLEGVLKEIVRD